MSVSDPSVIGRPELAGASGSEMPDRERPNFYDKESMFSTDSLGRVTTIRDERPRDAPERTDRQQHRSWRPAAVYAGTISAEAEVGLGSPPVGGSMLRRVTFRLRTELPAGTEDYWTISVRWRNEDDPHEIGSVSTETFMIRAHEAFVVWEDQNGVRLEDGHEATVLFTPTGSPAALSQVTVYPDWYVGV